VLIYTAVRLEIQKHTTREWIQNDKKDKNVFGLLNTKLNCSKAGASHFFPHELAHIIC